MLFGKQKTIKPKERKFQNSHFTKDADTLLIRQLPKITDIKSSLSISEDMYEKLYLKMFRNIAQIAQCVSASESHHHSNEFGYLDHVFECVVLSLRAREGFIYRSEQEDMIVKKKDVFTYAVVVASLCHDLGKLVTDIEFYNVDENQIHNVLYNKMEIGTEFIYRFYPQRRNEDHKSAGLMLLDKVVPKEGINWLLKESTLYRELIHSLSSNYVLANKLGELVIAADRHSTASNISLIAEKFSQSNVQTISSEIYNEMETPQLLKTASQINTSSRAISIINALKLCIENHENYSNGKKINQKGGFAWVFKDYIYVVHPKCFSLIDSVLNSSGSKVKITQHIVCYSILNDAGFIKKFDSLYFDYCEIKDDKWSAKLPMIRFYRNKLDPDFLLPESKMELFERNSESGSAKENKQEKIEKSDDLNQSTKEPNLTNPDSIAIDAHNNTEQPPIDCYYKDHREVYQHDEEPITQKEERYIEEKKPTNNDSQQNKQQGKNTFLNSFKTFLQKAFKSKNIDLNKNGAPIHIVDGKICLISPIIFKLYIAQISKPELYGLLGLENDISDLKLLKACQFAFFDFNHHYKDVTRKNILQFQVIGAKKNNNISGVLLKETFSKEITTEHMNNSRNVFLIDVIN